MAGRCAAELIWPRSATSARLACFVAWDTRWLSFTGSTSPDMRVLIVSPAYPPAPSGEAEHCFQIASRLAAIGHRVTVLAPTTTGARPSEGFELDACIRGWRWRDLPRLAWALRHYRPEAVLLIHTTWMYGGHPMVTFLPTVARRLLPNCRFVTLFEIYQEPEPAASIVRATRKIATVFAGSSALDYHFGSLLRDSTGLIALGPTMVKSFARHNPSVQERMVVVPPPPLVPTMPPPDPGTRQSTRASLGVGPNEVLLAYFGFVYPGKGVDTLIRAVHRLQARGLCVRLLMAGGGRDGTGAAGRHDVHEVVARQLAESLGVDDQIVWPRGYDAADDAMVRQLQAADLAVLPFDDGAELRRSSIAVVTAAGLPLVTTNPRPGEEAFQHGENVWLCPPCNPEALASAIETVSGDQALLRRLTDGAREMSSQWFSWDTAISGILSTLAEQVSQAKS